MSASRSRPPSSRTIDQTSQPIARSARIGGSLIRSPTPPSGVARRARRATGRTGSPACSRGRSRGRRSPTRPFVGEVVRPEPERAEVDLEPGAREQVCDDEAEGEPEREDHQDRADGSLRPGRPRRRSCASLGPTGWRGQSPGTAPARAWKVDRSVAQGRPVDPPADIREPCPRRTRAIVTEARCAPVWSDWPFAENGACFAPWAWSSFHALLNLWGVNLESVAGMVHDAGWPPRWRSGSSPSRRPS